MKDRVKLQCREVHRTGKAVLLDFEDAGLVWMPFVWISSASSYPEGGIFEITIPRWKAEEEGLVE